MKHDNGTLEMMQRALGKLNSAYILAMNSYDEFNKAEAFMTSRRLWHIAQIILCEIERIKGYDND